MSLTADSCEKVVSEMQSKYISTGDSETTGYIETNTDKDWLPWYEHTVTPMFFNINCQPFSYVCYYL